MGLADKRLGSVQYDVSLNSETGLIEAVNMLLTLSCKCYEGNDATEALQSPHHIVIRASYALSDFDSLTPPEVPQEAAQLLR